MQRDHLNSSSSPEVTRKVWIELGRQKQYFSLFPISFSVNSYLPKMWRSIWTVRYLFQSKAHSYEQTIYLSQPRLGGQQNSSPVFSALDQICSFSFLLQILNRFRNSNIMKSSQLLIFLFLCALALGDTIGPSESNKRVIQSDHFSSEETKAVSYKLQHIDKQKPLVFILKNKEAAINIDKNPISIKMTSGKSEVSCSFANFENICVITEPGDTKASIALACQSAPCSISWLLFQPQIKFLSSNHTNEIAHGLFNLVESTRHVIARIFCNDPDLATFSSDIEVYASSHYERGGSNNQIYIMFTNENKGFVYFDIKESSMTCAEVKIDNIPEKVSYSDQAVIDFTTKESSSSIRLAHPDKDIRVDCLFHLLQQGQKEVGKMTPFTISLSGLADNEWQKVAEHKIEPVVQEGQTSFSVTFQKVQSEFEELKLDVTTSSKEMIILDFVVTENDVQQISIGQTSYFQLKQSESIKYRLLPVPQADKDNQNIQIYISDKESFGLNQTKCQALKGCEFTLQAKKSGQGYLFTQLIYPDSKEEETKVQPKIQFLPIGRSFKRKGKIEEHFYLQKKVQKGKSFRINTNTPNVIIFAASEEKCTIPGEECSEAKGNIHHPIIYTPTSESNFRITVIVLQSCELALTIIEQNDHYITLQDGAPFSYTLYEKEQKLQFKYTLKQKKEVNFNLIAPLNTLLLIADNHLQTSQQVSTQGFITFESKNIDSLEFTVLVQKNPQSRNKQIHFTLIASTSDTVIRLDSTVAHYETIKQETYKEYVFEFNPSEEYIVSFYVHNIKEDKINVMLALSKDRSWNSQNLDKIWINKEADYIDLNTFSAKICRAEGLETCEIFMRLQNQMNMEVDISITLLTRNALIQLKDGIWQSYPESSIISEAHFYFYPKHMEKNIMILYHSNINHLKLSYNLWKTDSQSINPLEWPFPLEPTEFDLSSSKTAHQITIDKEALKETCWPYCVVLISLYSDMNNSTILPFSNQNIKIMATNNQIQLPEKTRVQMTLKTAQERDLIVDLKYAMNKEQITFFNTRLFGQYIVLGSLFSQKTNRCPLGKGASDYYLNSGENIFSMQNLIQKMKDLQIENDTNIYMCLSIRTEKDCKFSLEYTTSSENIKQVHLDSFEEVNLKANETKYFQIQGSLSFNAKIMRKSGFPSIYIKKCLISKLKECKQQLFQSKDKGKSILAKTEEFQEKPCEDCIYIFKFSSDAPAAAILHLKSKASMFELKQHEIITDFLQEEQTASYLLTHIIGKPLIVDIHVLEGDLQATLTDSNTLSLSKNTEDNQKLMKFYIEPEATSQFNQTHLGQSLSSAFKFSKTFKNFVLVLSKKEQNKSCIFSIVYSSGDSEIYLQDGLITDVTLEPEKPILFTYFKESKSHVYLTISTRKASDLKHLEIKSFYYDIPDDEIKVQFNLDMPKPPRDGPNPTLLFLLPPRHRFEFVLGNNDDSSFPISMGINHQEIMFLPFDHDYPFNLHEGQHLDFLVEIGKPGFIEITIRKCDQSSPTFSYAQHYDSYIKREFDNQKALSEESFFKELVKVEKSGVFYISFTAGETESSMLSINLTYYKEKPNRTHLRPGGRGQIEYELVQSKKAQITFMPILCKTSNCPERFKYYLIKSPTLQLLYQKMVCSSTHFSVDKQEEVQQSEIGVGDEDKIIDFVIDLKEHISYVGVKAIETNGNQIFYRPVEVITFWGQLSRTSHTHKITLAAFLLISVCSLMAFVRYNARRGYTRVQQDSQ